MTIRPSTMNLPTPAPVIDRQAPPRASSDLAKGKPPVTPAPNSGDAARPEAPRSTNRLGLGRPDLPAPHSGAAKRRETPRPTSEAAPPPPNDRPKPKSESAPARPVPNAALADLLRIRAEKG